MQLTPRTARHTRNGTFSLGVSRNIAVISAVLFGVLGALIVAPSAAQALIPTTPDSLLWGVNGRVRAIAATPTAIYVGGDFSAAVGPQGQSVPRTDLAAFDPQTGELLPFAPTTNGAVWDLSVAPDGTVYAAGTFSRVSGLLRGRAAAFTPNGDLLGFNPKADAAVTAVAATNDRIYLGGLFGNLNGQVQSRLAAVDLQGLPLPGFSASADAQVHDLFLTPEGSQLVVAGAFTNLSGNAQAKRLALLDPGTGAATALQTRVAYEIFAVTATINQIFAAGGGAGGHIYGFDRSTGLQRWATLSDGDAHGVGIQNGVLYVGGHFTKYSGQPASHVAAVSPSTGQMLPWSISVNSNLGVFTLVNYAGQVLIGGDFTKINRRPRSHLARFTESVDQQPPTVPGQPIAEIHSADSAKLSWPASVDNQSTEVTYQIFRDGQSVALVSSSATDVVSYIDKSLTPGNTYTWQLRAWDDAQVSALSPASEPLTLPDAGAPKLSKLELLDVNANGIVDQVLVTFTAGISCTAPCLSPWVLSNVPSGSTLAQVSISGRVATLDLTEGSGPKNTAVGDMTVELLADPAGIMDIQGRTAGFSATSPQDAAAPVPVDLDSTPGAVDNVMEEGDTFTASFSEPILAGSVQAANVKELDPAGPGNDRLIIVGLTDSSLDLGSDDYVTTDGGTIVYPQATLSLLAGNTQIQSTLVGPCAGSACGATGPGAGPGVPFTFRPEPILTDPSGNHATGSYTEEIAPY